MSMALKAWESEHAEDDHQHRAHERARGPVDLQARDLAQADEQVGDDENDECGDHFCQLLFRNGMRQCLFMYVGLQLIQPERPCFSISYTTFHGLSSY